MKANMFSESSTCHHTYYRAHALNFQLLKNNITGQSSSTTEWCGSTNRWASYGSSTLATFDAVPGDQLMSPETASLSPANVDEARRRNSCRDDRCPLLQPQLRWLAAVMPLDRRHCNRSAQLLQRFNVSRRGYRSQRRLVYNCSDDDTVYTAS